MPEKVSERGERRSEIRKYYSRNFENKTTAEIIDFLVGLNVAQLNDLNAYVSSDEMDEVYDMACDHIMPLVMDKNGEPIKEDGHVVVDKEKADKVMDEIADYILQLQIELAREYEKQLKSLPPDNKDREKIAMIMTQNSEALIKRTGGMQSLTTNLVFFDQDRYNTYKFDNEIGSRIFSWNDKYKKTLSEDEKKYFEASLEAMGNPPNILKNVKTEDVVGLNKDQLKALRAEKVNELVERADFNWTSDKTMGSKPKYMSEQLSSDKNSRYGRYYMTLDEEGKRKFILDGMLEKGNLDIHNGDDGLESVDCLSKKEKEVFRKACNVYFSPILKNGRPDNNLFMHRVDAVRDEIAGLYKEHARFVSDRNNFAGILDNTDDMAKRRKAAEHISPFYKKIIAYKKEMNDILGRKKISKELKQYYISQKLMGKDGGDREIKDVDFELQSIFSDEVEERSKAVLRDAGLDPDLIKLEEQQPFTDKEYEAINKKSDSVTIGMLKDYRESKPWLDTGRDVNLESLKKMNNLYEQFKNEDRLIYINSEEYNELKNRLKDAAHMYRKIEKGGEMSAVERAQMECTYDAISDAAMKYIAGKEEKERKSDHGQNRYEIAFAALGVASRGAVLEKIELHNIKHLLHDSKTLSINELMERADRTVKQQKTYEKTNKPKQKQRRSTIQM